MMSIRYRLARLLVGRFVTVPEPQGEHPMVILLFPQSPNGASASVMIQPTSFRMKSRTTMPSFADAETLTFTPRRTRTTFVGVCDL